MWQQCSNDWSMSTGCVSESGSDLEVLYLRYFPEKLPTLCVYPRFQKMSPVMCVQLKGRLQNEYRASLVST